MSLGPPDLVDKRKLANSDGEHSILMVSQLNCDKEETDFMASESMRLLNKH